MMQFLQKWLAIRSYKKKLGSLLIRGYGKSKHYTPAQVRTTVSKAGLSTDWICYAYSMYCSCDDFVQYHTETGQSCDYEAMRTEVADYFFQANTAFDASDVVNSSSDWFGGEDSGGGDGGDGGGYSD